MTASTQWFERTLDDSANRRIALPEAFLAVDAALRLYHNVASGLHVNEKVIEKAMENFLPFLATENLLMEGVKRGGDRQALHEIIRTHSMAATRRIKEGERCDLLERLAEDPAFPLGEAEIRAALDPAAFIGRCPEQVTSFLTECAPLLAGETAEMQSVRV